MNFASHYSALEDFAENHLGQRDSVLLTTGEIGLALGLDKEFVVGLYESYRRYSGHRFEFEKGFAKPKSPFDWQIRITRCAGLPSKISPTS